MRIKPDPSKILTNEEKAVINTALIKLRDINHAMYVHNSNPKGDVAQHSKQYAERIDQLRGKVLEL
jgi:hypothetical protein